MQDKISAEVSTVAENRYPAFDNTQKFIEIGYNIAYYRKHAGLTQEQLAERVGISRQHIGAIEAHVRGNESRHLQLVSVGFFIAPRQL